MEFCFRLSHLYTLYATYRIDWLLNWLDPQKNKLNNQKKAKILQDQPDYGWQRELWRYIATQGEQSDIENLKSIQTRVNEMHFTKDMQDKPCHLFMPFSLPPLLLPFLKAFAEKEFAPDLWLYIMNPCSEYWFDSLPIKLFDWNIAVDKVSEKFLRTNAASTRAMIDRLYRFLNADEDILDREAIEAEKALPSPEEPNIRYRFDRQDLLGSRANLTPQELQLFGNAEVQGYFFQNKEDSYLHKFQNSILLINSELLPNRADWTDESLKVFKAPTFTREIEAVVDWLHYRFGEDKTIQPTDILIAVPDINEATPAIEAVMEGLPDELKLPWKIFGNSIIDSDFTVTAILDLGKLITTPFDRQQFIDWLELPVNQQRWNLSLADISILSQWLHSAGFLKGLSDNQLKKWDLGGEDYSLQNAIERLSLGYLMDSVEQREWKDVLPIFGAEEGGWEKLSDNKGRLFKTLVSISQLMNSAWEELEKAKRGLTAQGWNELVGSWLTNFFELKNNPINLNNFRSALQKTIEGINMGLPNDTLVPFKSLWTDLELRLTEATNRSAPFGAITFAAAPAMRGIPYKIVVAAGFNENSGFPGNTNYDEFNLMGVEELKRRSDRDARQDNKAVFLDLMLCAREALVLSYSCGTDPRKEIGPSSVIESFKSYFVSYANLSDNGGKAAKELWNSILVDIPLNVFSEGNYQLATTPSSKHWVSPRKRTLESLKVAKNKQYNESDERFINAGIPSSALGLNYQNKKEISADTLIDFLINPQRFSLKKLALNSRDFYVDPEDYEWLPKSDALSKKIRFTQDFSRLKVGLTVSELEKRNDSDPSLGIKSIRKSATSDEIAEAASSLDILDSYVEDAIQCQKKIELKLPTTITSKTGVQFISDTLEDLYVTPDNKLILTNPGKSRNDRRKALLRHLIWHASGLKNVESLLYSPEAKAKNIFKDLSSAKALEIIGSFVQLFSVALKHGISLVDNPDNLD
ncbi:MAG: exodeoxyribonuclease V subunit gamma [Burkholderiales bacterium]|nr:exodeoxyribonuclease V subunit gamma [Burkholderiales bacterium]